MVPKILTTAPTKAEIVSWNRSHVEEMVTLTARVESLDAIVRRALGE
jgi:hypothetical protein